MELEEYIEEIELLLPKQEGRLVIRCVVEFCKLLIDIMPVSGKNGIEVAERFLLGNATESDLLDARVLVWKDHDAHYKNTPEGEALRAIICALFFPIVEHELFDTLTYAIDFCRGAKPSIGDSVYKKIIENEFNA